jgi:signal transduction histidine kinase
MGWLMSSGGIVWGAISVALGHYVESLVPLGYVVITLVNLGSRRLTIGPADATRVRTIQIAASMILPFVFQAMMGGLFANGVLMLWSWVALFGSLINPRLREGVLTFGLFTALCIASAAVEPWASARPVAAVVSEYRTGLLTLNVLMVGAIVFGLSLALTAGRNELLGRLRDASQRNVELNRRLSNTVADLYKSHQHIHATTIDLAESLDALRAAQSQVIQTEKLASLGSLVAGITHEINTPLGVAVTASSIARESVDHLFERFKVDQELREEALEPLHLLDVNLQRATKLIRMLRTVSVDVTADAVRPFELGAYVGEVLASLSPMIRQSRLTVIVDSAESIEVIQRPGPLAQIITNIVTNAIEHAFEPEEHGALRLVLRCMSETVLLEAQDNGRGMEPAIAARAFDPFFTTRGGSGGSGLGLFMVHSLVVDGLKGTISMETEPGRGTTLFIEFPSTVST